MSKYNLPDDEDFIEDDAEDDYSYFDEDDAQVIDMTNTPTTNKDKSEKLIETSLSMQ
jgi:hypothetical protein